VLSDAVLAALAGQAAVVVADATIKVSNVLAALRAPVQDDAVVLVLLPDLAAIDRVMLLAALGPLAIELSPRRIAAIDVMDGASPRNVVAAAHYLASACSITGQCLRVG
jgi:hypothetical protein